MTSRDIARISFEEVAAAAPGQSSAHYVIEATCLGLYGPDSPLPAYVNERIVARDRDATALRDFLDLFNHRILTLLCRIARRYRHIRVFDGAATDEIRQMVDILGRRRKNNPIARHFKAALLARMRVVPYVPLTAESLREIVVQRLDRVGARLKAELHLDMTLSEAVIDHAAARCARGDGGARDIDALVNRTLLARVSTQILAAMTDGGRLSGVAVGIGEQGELSYEFS